MIRKKQLGLTRKSQRFLSLIARLFIGGSLCLLLTSCPEENNEDENLYDPRNVTRKEDGIEAAPNLVIDSQGNIHMVYFAGPDYYAPFEVYYLWKGENGKWSKPINLSESENDSRTPKIAIDSEDRIHIVWQEDGEGTGRTKYTSKVSGGEWTEPLYITDSGNELPQIAIDGNDDLHVVGMGYSTYGLYLKNSNGLWGEIEQIYYNVNPAIDVSQNGDIHISHNSSSLLYFNRYDTGDWGEQIELDGSGNSPRAPDIAVDSNGNVYIAWATKYDDQVKHKIRNTDGNWSVTDTLPYLEGDPWTVKVATDPNGIHIVWNAYTEEGDFDIYYQVHGQGGSWSERINVSLTPTASLFPVIYLKDNTLHLAWHEKLGDSLESNRDIYYTTISVADY